MEMEDHIIREEGLSKKEGMYGQGCTERTRECLTKGANAGILISKLFVEQFYHLIIILLCQWLEKPHKRWLSEAPRWKVLQNNVPCVFFGPFELQMPRLMFHVIGYIVYNV